MTLTIERKIGMSGTCQRINARVAGVPDYFAVAGFDAPERQWGISIHNADGTESEYTVDFVESADDAIEHVEAIIRLAYASSYGRTIAASEVEFA